MSFVLFTSLFLLSAQAEVAPDSDQQWYLDFSDDDGGANVLRAWEDAYEFNETIRVAVLELNGVDVNHEDLTDNIYVNEDEIPDNGFDDDGNGYIDDSTTYSSCTDSGEVRVSDHATHVAGIIGARHNDLGISGINGDVEILPIAFLGESGECGQGGEASADSVARGITYAVDKGAHIINMSFFVRTTSESLEEAMDYAESEDVIIIIAAGNNGDTFIDYYPQKYGEDYENVILVASSTKDVAMSYFSTYHSEQVHIFAPGSDVFSTLSDNNYGVLSGTSMAAPIVAGVASLVLSTEGLDAAVDMRERLIDTSKRFEDFDGRVYSNGIVDAYNAILGQSSFNFRW